MGTNTRDGSEGEDNIPLTEHICVQNTKNVVKILIHDERHLVCLMYWTSQGGLLEARGISRYFLDLDFFDPLFFAFLWAGFFGREFLCGLSGSARILRERGFFGFFVGGCLLV